MEPSNQEITATQKSFEEVLNRNGFGFQFSVLAECKEVSTTWESRWRFLASEIPVEVRNVGTKIDFALEHTVNASGFSDVMICECKRVNPAFARWCFIPAPYTRRNSIIEVKRFESLSMKNNGLSVHTLEGGAERQGQILHLGLPVRVPNVKGDSSPVGNNRNDIEDAITQVLRGLNGYINLLAGNRGLIGNKTFTFYPTVFTTAELWVSNADLSKADLQTGNINLTKGDFQEVTWLWFQYNTSPGIKHSLSFYNWEKLEDVMENEFVRTVAIVNSSGIRDFLRVTTEEYLR